MEIVPIYSCPRTKKTAVPTVLRAFHLLLFILIFPAVLHNSSALLLARTTAVLNLADPNIRRGQVEQLTQRSQQRKAAALEIARQQNWPAKIQTSTTTLELMAIEGTRVYVYKTLNENSAVSIAADLVRDAPPFDVNGSDLTAGVWDAGAVRSSHLEFTSRVAVMDSASPHYHSTHVAGTLAAAGLDPAAMGMAPDALIDSYEWNDDLSEMTSRAMSYPNEPGKIHLSNHSYGYVCGWEYSFSPPRWYGTWGERESDFFGLYADEVAQWDQLCYSAPYYLPFKAAGNDRNDKAPQEGTIFHYYKIPPGMWKRKTYDPDTDPCDDGWDNGGFDTILIVSSAKNIMTVGAVYDAVTAGVRDPNKAFMTSFSGWGPTDDGRIKPDIVTNGTTVYSPTSDSDTSYASYSGTSTASPAAAGAAVLLVDYYRKLFGGRAMRASTLKALIIHAADDRGLAGPDYKFGWGLMNTKAAADIIAEQNEFPDANIIVEAPLDDVNTVHTYAFDSDGANPIRATLCWTDPPASALSELDDPSPRLINDLDLQITDPNGFTYYPYILDPAVPDAPAATGDNILDNIEQVLIQPPALTGIYTVRIGYKGPLTNGQQYYSLILTGQRTQPFIPADFNRDGLVNIGDLTILADYWLSDEPSVDIAPSQADGVVNFKDLALLAQSFE